MSIRMELARILIRETQDHHVVELREVDGERTLPIMIGLFEAAAIERRLMGQKPPRPQTHELLDSVIKAMGGEVERVVITDLDERTFFARLYIRQGDKLLDIDARPSDAIALGVTSDVPIFVAENVLDEALPPPGM